MKKLASLVLIISALLIWAMPVLADSRAEEILKQAREAVGGEQQLLKVQGLSIVGQYRRVFGERQMGGDREISISLPNKYVVEDSMNPGGMSTAMINTRTLNGDHAWTGSSGGGGGMFIRMGGPGGQQATPEQIEAALKRSFQIEMARYLLATTLAGPESFPLEYKYAGESEVEDAKAEVLDVTGPDKFAVRIFFDKESHLPLLLSYRGPKPRIMTMTRPAGGAPPKPEDLKKAREDAEKKMHAEGPEKPEEAEFYIRLSDHKKVSGLMLPHKFTFLTDNEVSEEFEVSKFQMNPQFKSDRFEKR
jgi:hypothetical protein